MNHNSSKHQLLIALFAAPPHRFCHLPFGIMQPSRHAKPPPEPPPDVVSKQNRRNRPATHQNRRTRKIQNNKNFNSRTHSTTTHGVTPQTNHDDPQQVHRQQRPSHGHQASLNQPPNARSTQQRSKTATRHARRRNQQQRKPTNENRTSRAVHASTSTHHDNNDQKYKSSPKQPKKRRNSANAPTSLGPNSIKPARKKHTKNPTRQPPLPTSNSPSPLDQTPWIQQLLDQLIYKKTKYRPKNVFELFYKTLDRHYPHCAPYAGILTEHYCSRSPTVTSTNTQLEELNEQELNSLTELFRERLRGQALEVMIAEKELCNQPKNDLIQTNSDEEQQQHQPQICDPSPQTSNDNDSLSTCCNHKPQNTYAKFQPQLETIAEEIHHLDETNQNDTTTCSVVTSYTFSATSLTTNTRPPSIIDITKLDLNPTRLLLQYEQPTNQSILILSQWVSVEWELDSQLQVSKKPSNLIPPIDLGHHPNTFSFTSSSPYTFKWHFQHQQHNQPVPIEKLGRRPSVRYRLSPHQHTLYSGRYCRRPSVRYRHLSLYKSLWKRRRYGSRRAHVRFRL